MHDLRDAARDASIVHRCYVAFRLQQAERFVSFPKNHDKRKDNQHRFIGLPSHRAARILAAGHRRRIPLDRARRYPFRCTANSGWTFVAQAICVAGNVVENHSGNRGHGARLRPTALHCGVGMVKPSGTDRSLVPGQLSVACVGNAISTAGGAFTCVSRRRLRVVVRDASRLCRLQPRSDIASLEVNDRQRDNRPSAAQLFLHRTQEPLGSFGRVGYGRHGLALAWMFSAPPTAARVVLFPLFTMKGNLDRTRKRRQHFYFEKYEVLDGESTYPLMSVRRTSQPLGYETWMREFIEFSWSTNCEEPWSEERIRDYFDGDDESLEVYCDERIYRRFRLEEISQAEYEVLWNYLF